MQPSTFNPLAGALCASLLLAACGGGSDGLSAGEAQGYAADATAMPVSAADGLDSGSEALESALSAGATAGGARAMPLAVIGAASGTADCAAGGTLAWTVAGGTESTQGNGELDAGETFTVDYTACATADGGPVLDGTLAIAVTERTLTGADVTMTATDLMATTARGSFTSNGSVRRVRNTVALEGGGRQTTVHLTSAGLTLASVIGTRQASYTLNSLDWTVVRSFNGDGALVSRTHAGELDLDASTPRRPNATLVITTDGALTLDSGGHVSAGLMTVTTDRNRIEIEHGGGSVTLRLDRGNDGNVDRTWTLTRQQFESEAG